LLDKWRYFDRYEPRLGVASLLKYLPPLADANFVLHYRLGRPEKIDR
jgi:hypothetical protein